MTFGYTTRPVPSIPWSDVTITVVHAGKSRHVPLTRATMGAICRHDRARQLVATMMAEALEIAEAVGAHPQISIQKRLAGAEKVGEHKTSTLQDLEAGKPLELAAIIGAVVELADLTGIEAPGLRAIDAASSLLAETLGLSDGG